MLVLQIEHVELHDVRRAAEERANIGHGASKVAMAKLLDVRARLRHQVELAAAQKAGLSRAAWPSGRGWSSGGP